MRNVLGRVEPAERDEIRELHKRKVALKELVFSIAKLRPEEMGHIYDRLVGDMAETCFLFDRWWATKRTQYGWPMNVHMEIDFTSCDVWTNAEEQST